LIQDGVIRNLQTLAESSQQLGEDVKASQPSNDVVVVVMMRNVNGSLPTGGSPQVRPLSRQLVYQALVDPRR
jgi:hypothetical protein